jgi:hypothetical protein
LRGNFVFSFLPAVRTHANQLHLFSLKGYFAEFDNGGLVSEFAMPASGEPAVELNGTSIIESFGSGLPGTYRGFTATENPAAPTSRGIVYIVTNQALTRFVYGDSGWSPGISISGASGTPFMGPSLRVGNTIYFAATSTFLVF